MNKNDKIEFVKIKKQPFGIYKKNLYSYISQKYISYLISSMTSSTNNVKCYTVKYKENVELFSTPKEIKDTVNAIKIGEFVYFSEAIHLFIKEAKKQKILNDLEFNYDTIIDIYPVIEFIYKTKGVINKYVFRVFYVIRLEKV